MKGIFSPQYRENFTVRKFTVRASLQLIFKISTYFFVCFVTFIYFYFILINVAAKILDTGEIVGKKDRACVGRYFLSMLPPQV